MPQPPLPNAKYRSRLRQVIRLLSREKVVEASDLLDELKLDTTQFERFTKSPAYRPFCKAIDASRRYWETCAKNYQAMLVVLSYIRADLRPQRRPKTTRTKTPATTTASRQSRRTRGTRR